MLVSVVAVSIGQAVVMIAAPDVCNIDYVWIEGSDEHTYEATSKWQALRVWLV